MNIFIRFIVRLLFVAGTIKTSITRRMVRIKSRSLQSQPVKVNKALDVQKANTGTGDCLQERRLKVFFYGQTQWRVSIKVIKTGPLKQDEFFKWAYDPDFPYKRWTSIDFLIRNERYEEQQHNKRMGRLNFRAFDKKKFKPDPHSQKLMDEAAERRKRRAPSIQAADGMLWRGTYPIHLLQKGSGIIVVNGVWPDEIT